MFANHDSDRTEQAGMKSLDGCKDGLVLQQRAPHTLRCWLSLPFEGAGFHPQSLAGCTRYALRCLLARLARLQR